MKKTLILLIGLLALSCNKKDDPSLFERIQGSWKVVSTINSEGNKTDISAAQGNFVITFMNNSTLDIIGPCNSGNGTYLLSENGGVSFNDVAISRIFCNAIQNTFEEMVVDALSKGYYLERTGNELKISSNSNNNLVLNKN